MLKRGRLDPARQMVCRLSLRPVGGDFLDPRFGLLFRPESAALFGRTIAPGDEHIPCVTSTALTGLEFRLNGLSHFETIARLAPAVLVPIALLRRDDFGLIARHAPASR